MSRVPNDFMSDGVQFLAEIFVCFSFEEFYDQNYIGSS